MPTLPSWLGSTSPGCDPRHIGVEKWPKISDSLTGGPEKPFKNQLPPSVLGH
jgi:hypothetical protein